MKRKIQIILAVIICLGIAGASYHYARPWATADLTHAESVSYLDGKKSQVLELAGLSTAASVVISMLPDDTATPIATQLSELSKYFIIILTAIYLEKFLVSIIGFAVFGVVIPAACLLYLFFVWSKNETLKHVAIKAAVFSLAIYFVIPAAVKVDQIIEARNSTTLEESIDAVRLDLQSSEEETEPAPVSDTQGSHIVIGWIEDRVDDLKGIGEQASSALEYGKTILTHFVDAIAIMIVTSCVMPILIVLVFFIMGKIILGVDIQPTAVKVIEIAAPNKWKRLIGKRPEPPMFVDLNNEDEEQ